MYRYLVMVTLIPGLLAIATALAFYARRQILARQPVARHGGVALGEVPNPLREINKMPSKERSHFLDFEIEGQWCNGHIA
jgi:hypothetical protein